MKMNKTNKNTVLIIDDESNNIIALKKILETEYNVFAEVDSLEAVETVAEILPDIILLDVIMPDMDGYDVINILKSTENTKDMPVIFITGLDEIYAEEKALTLGASDYILKPFNSGIVRLRVRNQIKLLERLRQQALMTEISHMFLTDAHIDELLNDTLRMVGEFMAVEKILLFKNEKDEGVLTCRNEWVKPGLQMETGIGEELEFKEPVLSAINDMQSGGGNALCFTSNDPAAREAMKPYRGNLHAFIVLPVFVKGKLHAIIDLSKDENGSEWSESEINLAVLVSSVISGVFTRNAIEHDLEAVLKLQTELVAAKEQAEYSSRAKSEFLSRMSHEMLTPVNAINGLLRVIKMKPEKTEGYLGDFEKASQDLHGLINSVLDISYVEYGITELEESEFSFREMLDTVIKEAAGFSETKKQKVTSEIKQSVPEVLIGDKKHLSQIVANILANAIKFTPDRGEIHISAHVTDNEKNSCRIQIEVTDNGIGIAKENHGRLFELFEQVDGSHSRKHGGIGIGLALSKRYIEKMDGIIRVESELGKGSKFIINCKLGKANQL